LEVRVPYKRNSVRPKLVSVEVGSIDEEPEQEYITLVLRKDVKLTVTGAITGETYIFDRAGSMCSVDKRDAEILLKREVQKTCCGGISQPYFEIYTY